MSQEDIDDILGVDPEGVQLSPAVGDALGFGLLADGSPTQAKADDHFGRRRDCGENEKVAQELMCNDRVV